MHELGTLSRIRFSELSGVMQFCIGGSRDFRNIGATNLRDVEHSQTTAGAAENGLMSRFAMRPRKLPMKRSVGCLMYSEVPKKLQHHGRSAAARSVGGAIFSDPVRTRAHQTCFLICIGTAAEWRRRVNARQDFLELRGAEGFEHPRPDRI